MKDRNTWMRPTAIIAVVGIIALTIGGLAVTLFGSASQAADEDDPTTAPIPVLEFPSELGKVLSSEVMFNPDGSVTASAGQIHRGGTPAREGLPEVFLRVELRDDEDELLGSFPEWDPRHLRQYDGADGHFHEDVDSGELTLIAPFEPALAEVVVTDAETGEEFITIDATGPAAEFCRNNLDDPDCAADLAISATDDPDPAVAGEQLTYEVTVMNQGPNPAHEVKVTSDLPEGVAHASNTASCTEPLAGQLQCELGRLPADDERTFEIVVDINPSLVHDAGGPTTIQNQLSVSDEASSDPDAENNTTEVDTLVEAEGDLEVSSLQAFSPPDEQVIGESDEVDVEAIVANGGPSTPMDVTTSWSVGTDAGVSAEPTTAQDDTGALATGSPEAIVRTFKVECENPGLQEVRVTAEVAPASDDDTDPNPANNQQTVSFEVDCVVPITINIKPGEEPNTINSDREDGDVPIALLTTSAGEFGNPIAFDATTVVVSTTRAGTREAVDAGRGATPAHDSHDGHEEDSWEPDNETRDGDADLVIHFGPPSDTELERGDTELCVRGEYDDPSASSRFRFVGCDEVRVVR